jgi:hypothetical protein
VPILHPDDDIDIVRQSLFPEAIAATDPVTK